MLHPSAVLPQEFPSLFASDPAKVRFMLFRLGQSQETFVVLRGTSNYMVLGLQVLIHPHTFPSPLHEGHWG